MKKVYNALSIAGTDPISGAGIQSDLKTFSALGVYATTVITSLVAQNTFGVQSIYPIDANFVLSQIKSVVSDVNIDTIKIGMVGESKIIKIIANKIRELNTPYVVLDTVMTSKNGDLLLDKKSVSTLKEVLLPCVSIVTPNLHEAAVLLDCPQARNENEMYEQGKALLNLGCKVVLIKGGHLNTTTVTNILISDDYEIKFISTRIKTNNTHGTGCTLSSALAAIRLICNNWVEASKMAIIWLHRAILYANMLNVGHGTGPVNHFYEWWKLDNKIKSNLLRNDLRDILKIIYLK